MPPHGPLTHIYSVSSKPANYGASGSPVEQITLHTQPFMLRQRMRLSRWILDKAATVPQVLYSVATIVVIACPLWYKIFTLTCRLHDDMWKFVKCRRTAPVGCAEATWSVVPSSQESCQALRHCAAACSPSHPSWVWHLRLPKPCRVWKRTYWQP